MIFRLLLLAAALVVAPGCTYSVISHSGNHTLPSLQQELPRRPLKAAVVMGSFRGENQARIRSMLLSSGVFSEVEFRSARSDDDVEIKLSNYDCGPTFTIFDSLAWVVGVPYTVGVYLPMLGMIPSPFSMKTDCSLTMSYRFPNAATSRDKAFAYHSYDYTMRQYKVTFTYPLFTSAARERYQMERVNDQAFAGLIAKIKANAGVLEQ